MKLIENFMTSNRAAKEGARLAEAVSFFRSIGIVACGLDHGPDSPELDWSDFHQEISRIRHHLLAAPPLGLFKIKIKASTFLSEYSAEAITPFGISLTRRSLLSGGQVPFPDAGSLNGMAPLPSEFLFRVSFRNSAGQDSPQSPSNGRFGSENRRRSQRLSGIKKEPGQGSPVNKPLGKKGRRRSQGQPDTKEEPDQDDEDGLALPELPRVVLELGHVVIVDLQGDKWQTRTDAPHIPTGLGLFLDMADKQKTLWLLRTTRFMFSPANPGGPLKYAQQTKELSLDGKYGAICLTKGIHQWMGMNERKQMEVLTGGQVHYMVDPMFEKFMLDPSKP